MRQADRFVLIEEPWGGSWSLPGGRIESGEPFQAGAVREVFTFVVPDAGGVSAVRFDADGDVVDAYPILRGSNSNCAGGPMRTVR